MTPNRRREIRERVELLELAGPGDGEQPCNGELSVSAACAEHDLSPLNGCAKRPFGDVVGGFDTLVLHEREEIQVVHDQRSREVADVGVRGIHVAQAECEELLLERQRFRDQLVDVSRVLWKKKNGVTSC